MSERQVRQLRTEVKFAALWLGGCLLVGFAMTFPFAFRTALRRSKET